MPFTIFQNYSKLEEKKSSQTIKILKKNPNNKIIIN